MNNGHCSQKTTLCQGQLMWNSYNIPLYHLQSMFIIMFIIENKVLITASISYQVGYRQNKYQNVK
jgi:hypothetical protein